jgi:hypothetical protein
VRLDKRQRNAILKSIEAADLDPRDFELANDPDGDAEARIGHGTSESYFAVRPTDGIAVGYEWNEVVGDQPVFPYPRSAHTWPDLLKRLRRWLAEVKDDIETPDLWAELQSEREMLAAAPENVENVPFTAEERAELATQLREIKKYATRNHSLSENQVQALEARLEYLEEAAGRLGRLDWRNAAVGAMVTFAAEMIVAPEEARRILLMILQPLGHLFGHPFPELPPGH